MKPAVNCLFSVPKSSFKLGGATLCVAALLWHLSLPAHALYKCAGQGSVIYSDRPCDGARQDMSLAPTASGHPAGSVDPLAKEKTELSRLQKSREQRERQEQQIRDLYARGAAARARKCSTLSLQLRWRQEDLRDATLKDQQKARVRARRAAEKYAMECH